MKPDETPVPQTGHINTNWPANAVGDVSNTVVLVWTIWKPRTENHDPLFERLFEQGLVHLVEQLRNRFMTDGMLLVFEFASK